MKTELDKLVEDLGLTMVGVETKKVGGLTVAEFAALLQRFGQPSQQEKTMKHNMDLAVRLIHRNKRNNHIKS